MAAPVKEVANLSRFDKGPICGGQRDIIRKSSRPEINLGQGYYAYCGLKRYGTLTNALSNLRDKKDLGRQACVFYKLKIF